MFASHYSWGKYCQVTVFRAEALVTLLLASVGFQNRPLTGQARPIVTYLKLQLQDKLLLLRTKNQEIGADHFK